MANNRMLLHLKLPDDDLLSACGIRIPPSNLTEVEDEVSCMSCQRHFNPVSRPYNSKRGAPGYADAQNPGLGVLHCFNCGRPIRDHPVAQPCSFPPQHALTTSRVNAMLRFVVGSADQ